MAPTPCGVCVSMDVAVVVVRRRLRLADDDEPPVGGAQHLDRHAVQARSASRRDDLLDRSLDGAAARQVDDAVEIRRAAG